MKNNKVGIITFHNSNNCGSMLESFAMNKIVNSIGYDSEIINYSSKGQLQLYQSLFPWNSLKNIIKNIVLLTHKSKLDTNNKKYQEFKQKYMSLSSNKIQTEEQVKELNYSAFIAGSDQIWNVTIEDYNDIYFLPWVKNTLKIAYAPSFGAKNPSKYDSKRIEIYKKFLQDFDFLSVRENNGQKWIKEISGRDAEVVLDPTLLLPIEEYNKLERTDINLPKQYIFFYSPGFDLDICDFVKKVSKKYNLPVITWSAKPYYVKGVQRYGFELPDYEDPSTYLTLIKNATLVFTTSFHGTIFSSLYRKKFFVLKNGGMYGTDDRVITLVDKLKLNKHLIEYKFNKEFDYLREPDYSDFEKALKIEKEKSLKFLESSLSKIK